MAYHIPLGIGGTGSVELFVLDGLTATATAPVTLDDLTTIWIPHLESLYDTTPEDYPTLVAADIPTVRADANSLQEDLNTDYAIYLSD